MYFYLKVAKKWFYFNAVRHRLCVFRLDYLESINVSMREYKSLFRVWLYHLGFHECVNFLVSNFINVDFKFGYSMTDKTWPNQFPSELFNG